MNKRLHLIAVLFFIATISMAQEVPGAVEKKKKGCNCGYSSLYSVGFLEGDAGTEAQLQTIQGIRYGKWFTGIGVGLDYYHLRGIPVFLDMRHTILKTKHSPFIYADGGVHFAWPTDRDKGTNGSNSFSDGLFYDLGLGYRMAIGKGAFLVSAGYSYKYIKEERIGFRCLGWDCTWETREYFKYKLNRLSLKFGMQL